MSFLQLSPGTVECLGWVLVHSVWQLTIVALLAAILGRSMRHPAIWWLSHRVRTERENCCCDDAAVGVTSDRLEYGRALLALADMRGSKPSLTLGANSGSLVDRIRRLVGAEQRNTLAGGRPLGLALAAVLAGLMVPGLGVHGAAEADEADETDETEEVEWARPSHGLVCRILPVDPAMDEQAVSMKKWDQKYSTSGNTTFAVELKNVSDRPIKLVGVRHAATNKKHAGQSNSNSYGPHLFHFEFTHADGRPLGEASRQFAVRTQPMFLTDMSTHLLAPNETLKVLLRPAKFERSTEYRIPPGKFRVNVRYREPRLVWGPEKDGLQAALEVVVPPDAGDPTSKPGVLVGTSLYGTFHVKNVGDKTITFVSESGRQGDTVHVTDAGGRDEESRKDRTAPSRPIG